MSRHLNPEIPAVFFCFFSPNFSYNDLHSAGLKSDFWFLSSKQECNGISALIVAKVHVSFCVSDFLTGRRNKGVPQRQINHFHNIVNVAFLLKKTKLKLKTGHLFVPNNSWVVGYETFVMVGCWQTVSHGDHLDNRSLKTTLILHYFLLSFVVKRGAKCATERKQTTSGCWEVKGVMASKCKHTEDECGFFSHETFKYLMRSQ